MTYFTDQNSTQGYKDVYSTLSLLKKKNNKYDIFAYDANYLKEFAPYLLELEKHLSRQSLEYYSSNDNRKLTEYNGHRYGMPFILIFTILFSNVSYLENYNKTIPKTWDELLETSKYIIEREREDNNNTIIGYNGLFPNNENTMCSIYQFLYSYRDEKDSGLPDFNSETASNAFDKLMQIKNEISTGKIMNNE
ncbi:hypothetical protein BCR32DRAFT_245916 [Anaeromyces robustus]|uniref:Periplasmic binding protein-like II n=1 Tax=Anaeromyces robustus TaxID=1754192 RepID=A0A1Y1X3T7_9FUNG|nr:hypothetical protein BCR32DRAFT_245916 [Anaeromyces robustus]|eukprot:ORX80036.1 hypothetical protein BCR32DRAFT_245916 [Anaeromyces robustus]